MKTRSEGLLRSNWVVRILYLLICALGRTYRFDVTDSNIWLDYRSNGGRILLCCWHQNIFPGFVYSLRYRKLSPAVMISRSKDGELATRLARKGGWVPVRGSSSRGGGPALRSMIRKIQKSRLAVHVADGPRGPAGVIKSGTAFLALASRAAAVSINISADRAWHLNSWDRMLIPKPFARVKIRYGSLILPQKQKHKSNVPALLQALEASMHPVVSNLNP